MAPLLQVEELSVAFRTRGGTVSALDRVSFTLEAGETLGLVGESGSGKSVTALAILGLLDGNAQVLRGAIRVQGEDVLRADARAWQRLRRGVLAMVFQNPRRALNPVRTVGQHLVDALRAHTPGAGAARREAIGLLERVGIRAAAQRFDAYPHEFSGGMCQRVLIALALTRKPALLVADEPTTGLDVTTQAAILDLLAELARERGMATLLITHDLGLAAQRCDRVTVMHAGQVVEQAPVAALFAQPAHPYTRGLLAATPRPGVALQDLAAVPGDLPDLTSGALAACRFHARCERAGAACAARPELRPLARGAAVHHVACWNPP